jgi:hypothetical protein
LADPAHTLATLPGGLVVTAAGRRLVGWGVAFLVCLLAWAVPVTFFLVFVGSCR